MIKRVNNYMAMLRNLRNIIEVGVDDDHLHKVAEAVKYRPAILNSRQFPFRFLQAYNAIKDIAPPYFLDSIEEALEISLENLPTFKGKTMSLCDNSGSATGTTTSVMGTMQVSAIANLSAVITGKVSEEGWLGVFGDNLAMTPVRKKSSIFDQVNAANTKGESIGPSTENGIWLFWRDALENSKWWDNIFIYSDMQAGHGGLYGLHPEEYRDYLWRGSSKSIDVAKLINKYRSKVNPNVNVFLCQVSGYQDTIVPEFYNRVYIMGGWSTGILNFAHKMIESNSPSQ